LPAPYITQQSGNAEKRMNEEMSGNDHKMKGEELLAWSRAAINYRHPEKGGIALNELSVLDRRFS